MKKLMALGLLLICCHGVFAQTCWYQSTSGKNTSVLVYQTTRKAEGGSIDLVYNDSLSEDTHHLLLDTDGSTREWIIVHTDGSRSRFVREGNTLVLGESGEERTLDPDPWFGSIEAGLSEMTRKGIKKLDFWILDPEKLEVRKLTARSAGYETLDLNGEQVETVKIKVTAKGVPALFYSVSFWFRKADGIFLRFKGINGPPGTPLTITSLTKEETR
jgi:hypothetical protein